MFYKVIKYFHEHTDVPVVLNTSINGPGEPVVETPADAVAMFLKHDLDVLYLDDRRVTRCES